MGTNIHAQTVATPRILAQGQLTNVAATTFATVPAGSTWHPKTAHVVNTTGSQATITLDVVPSGQVSGVTRRVLTGMTIGASETVDLSWVLGGLQLREGDFIAAWSGTASALTLTITGVEAS